VFEAVDRDGGETHLKLVTEEDRTIREARAAFFAENGFGAGGGYDDAWQEAEFGPLPYRVPNPPARGAALRIHDLHHVATGYTTDWRGEAEISAWELGSGIGPVSYAWVTVVFGLFTGLVGHLGPTYRAFVRGRRSVNLFAYPFDAAWLDMSVGALQRYLRLSAEPHAATVKDRLLFAAWSGVALIYGAIAIPFVVLMVFGAALRQIHAGRCPLSTRVAA